MTGQIPLFDDEPFYYPMWARWEPLTPDLLPDSGLGAVLFLKRDMEGR
jgi:hypothetical protein